MRGPVPGWGCAGIGPAFHAQMHGAASATARCPAHADHAGAPFVTGLAGKRVAPPVRPGPRRFHGSNARTHVRSVEDLCARPGRRTAERTALAEELTLAAGRERVWPPPTGFDALAAHAHHRGAV